MSDQSTTDALLKDLEALCRSDSLSVDGLRERIERHGNNIHVENYDFFPWACRNERVTEGIIRCLLEYFPDAINAIGEGDGDTHGDTPLHFMCLNKNATRGMVQLLIDANPESIDKANSLAGAIPLHFLCSNKSLENSAAVDILGLLLERCPEAVRRAGKSDALPIHLACGLGKSTEFCRMLIEAYPGSERIATSKGTLPLHIACKVGAVVTAKYLFGLYPESINVADRDGVYPVHYAMVRLMSGKSTNPAIAAEMVQMLLDCDPNVASQKFHSKVPLVIIFNHACNNRNDPSILNAAVKILHLLYDTHPEAIEDNGITSNIGRRDLIIPREIQTFINTQLTYARQARDSTLMSTRDENGQLPLHLAFQHDPLDVEYKYNATFGSIKLLVKGNRDAVRIPDNDGSLPLHNAVQGHNGSPYATKVVDYLIGLDLDTLTAVDREGNTALHHACLKAEYNIITLLLGKYGAVSVSKRNVNNKLPIHLLLENDLAGFMEDVEYMESIFLLLRAYPEALMMPEDDEQQSLSEGGCLPRIGGKKRKLCLLK
jgi:ankyrin repeat protein